MRGSIWIFTPALLLSAAAALAAEPAQPRYNTVTLQAQAQREVQNDLLNATLYVEANDPTATGVANIVNKSVNEALRVAKDYKSVRVRSGSNQTFPVYSRSNQLQGWRGRGEIRIESRDFDAASALIGKLQSGMQLGSINFSVSRETRQAAEDELAIEAIAAFKARAELLRKTLGGRGYKLQNLNVSSGHNVPQPRFAMARASSSAQEVTPLNIEGGFSVITVTTNGAIEVLE
jgi:predicted secreted protein